MSRPLLLFFCLTSTIVTSFGCTKKTSTPETSTASVLTASGQKSGQKEVSLAIWANYFPDDMQERFTKETGIKLRISNFSSNEELLAKIQAGASGIDVAVPSDYMVGVMTKLDLIEALDKNQLPNFSGLDPVMLNQDYDPGNRFSLPYALTTTGIAVNRDLYKGSLQSWKDFFTNADLAGKVLLLDDAREVIGAALKMHGFSVNTTKPEELDQAKATLKAFRSRVKMFRSDVADAITGKEVAVAQCYSSEMLLAKSHGAANLEYIYPSEGGTRAIDNLVILKGTKHSDEAHQLLNFLISRDANLAFVKKNFGGPVVKATRALLPADLRDNPALFPPPAVFSKLETIKDLGEAGRLYDRVWTEVKAE